MKQLTIIIKKLISFPKLLFKVKNFKFYQSATMYLLLKIYQSIAKKNY